MAKKIMNWKTKGMNRDLSVSAFNPEFAFENHNLRLSTNENNTLMSWVNEKGTAELKIFDTDPETPSEVTIDGVAIGTAVLNHKLVLFTTNCGGDYNDKIYLLWYSNLGKTQMQGKVLYEGNLSFNVNYPLETLVSYESEIVQKVYWTDGNNQPRVINIAKDTKKDIFKYDDTSFDFIPTLKLKETIKVKKELGATGVFAPGVIQYAFTYYRKYGQESCIFYTTPLYYISYKDRGGAPDDKIENAFKITVENPDTNFDYLRIYSIQRTSINGTPICKRIQDIPVPKNKSNDPIVLQYIDTGTSGDTIDPTELLYKGGEEITAVTMEQKDSTLFLGNLVIKRKQIKDLKSDIENGTTLAQGIRTIYPTKVSDNNDSYEYYSQLTAYKDSNKTESIPCAGFKCGDYYRCGVQFQHETGNWTEPVFLKDVQIEEYSSEGIDTINLPTLIGTLSSSVASDLIESGYKKARAVVVYPEVQDRIVLCQGVVNPTVYTTEQRTNSGNLYAQASWFFRPNDTDGGTVKYNDNGAIWPKSDGDLVYTNRGVQLGVPDTGCVAYFPTYIRQVEIQGDYDPVNQFKIDQSFLTLNSPDVEFDDYLTTIDFENVKFKRVGKVFFNKTLSDIDIQTESPAISNNAAQFVHKSFSKDYSYGIVSGLFYDDYVVDDLNDDNNASSFGLEPKQCSPLKWMVYLWNKTGSLNNDVTRPAASGMASALLKKKIVSNLRIASTSWRSTWGSGDAIWKKGVNTYEIAPQLFNSEESTIVKVEGKIYRGNIDTVLIPDNSDGMYCAFNDTPLKPDPRSRDVSTSFTSTNWWKVFSGSATEESNGGLWKYETTQWTEQTDCFKLGDHYLSIATKKEPVRMKYKSAPHLVFKDNSSPSAITWDYNSLSVLEIINSKNLVENSGVWTKADTLFGGTSSDALRENVWIPCGEPVDLENTNGDNNTQGDVVFKYEYGDTYFQRYDCLKTYAFTHEDINQVIEIGSFMLETRVNIDGRYDRNRGQLSNLYMSPQNFNLINPVYSQINNFFSYKIMDEDSYKNTVFPNQITWSKTKQAGADVDLWTNITLASILELDGDKGSLNKLARFNDQLLAFQDTGISQVLYNENVQISSTQGVPIEIANSGKVQGKRYISDTIGCFNKWSVVSTPMGLYFMDSNDKSIYQFNGQLSNLSIKGGMNTWCKKEIPTIAESLKWTPDYLTGPASVPAGFNNFVAYYDKQNQDVLFINKDTSLAFSEKIGAFTSFYAYGKSAYLCNLDDTGIWIKNMHLGQSVGSIESTALWKHQAGDYCKFFGRLNAYSMTLVGNTEPLMDKIFTNLEFRASVDGDGSTTTEGGETVFNKFYLPFDKLEAWDEYQHGITTLSIMNGHNAMLHGGTTSSLKRKFRIWRCDIPRDNAELNTDAALGISRYSRRPNDRMRNPWLYLKLTKIPKPETPQYRTEIHDVMMTYFD